MTSTITVGGHSVTLVDAPSSLLARAADFKVTDSVAVVNSPFTGQTQRQIWPGADHWTLTLTFPPLDSDGADVVEAFLMEMRGMANAAQFGDPRRAAPKGSVDGVPLIDNTASGGNAKMTSLLGTKGWTHGASGVLLRNDCLQIGYRMHRVLDRVNADGSGKALIPVWPSLREVPVDGAAIVLNNPRGLFSLAANDRAWSGDITRTTRVSIALAEYR